MTAAGALDALGGWASLWQGAVGSALGSIIGILGAYLLSVHTIRRQLETERLLARERKGVDLADELVAKLAELVSALSRLETLRLLVAVKNVDDDEDDDTGQTYQEVSKRVLELSESIVREVNGRARWLPAGLTEQCFSVSARLPTGRWDGTGFRAYLGIAGRHAPRLRALRDSLDAYRLDPLGWIARERRGLERGSRLRGLFRLRSRPQPPHGP